MKRNDFLDQAQDLLSEYGAQYRIDGDTIKWWFEADKVSTSKIPAHVGDYRGLRNSEAVWRKNLEKARPAHFVLQQQSDEDKDKWMAYLDKRLHEIEVNFETRFAAMQGEVSAATDIALDAGSKMDGFAKAFQFAQTPSPASSAPEPIEQPKIAIALTVPKPPQAQPKENGLNALEQLRVKQRAEIVARMNEEFALDELDLRILFFLHETGAPQTAHALRVAGVWKPISSATKHLENMEADGLVVFTPAKEWGITKKGIGALQDAFEEDSEEEAHPSAFEKIEEGLTEALAFARGEPNHAKVKVATPSIPPEAPKVLAKPTLSVVPPSGGRVLRPITRVEDLELTFVQKAMVALLKGDMIMSDLQKAIGHRANYKSLANMLYKCEREQGYVKFHYEQGQKYHITDKGRAYIQRIVPGVGQILAAS